MENGGIRMETLLIVGLGNPGEKYAHTRHNAGFDTMDRLAAELGLEERKRLTLKAVTAEQVLDGKRVIFCRPQTFMNNSGQCVRGMFQKYGIRPENLLVIYDDIDLPPGRIRVRKSGGPGTHNGMRSIVAEIGTDAFPRIRIGTGDRPAGEDLAEWVLGRCAPGERAEMEEAFGRAAECALVWVREGIEAAMARGNQKKKEERNE